MLWTEPVNRKKIALESIFYPKAGYMSDMVEIAVNTTDLRWYREKGYEISCFITC